MIPNNPAEILRTLDQQLDHEVALVLYGRAALCLGFDQAPPAFQNTQDVDAIISLSQLPELTGDDLEAAFASVRMPDVPELRGAFDRALPVVRKILQTACWDSSE